MTLQRAASTEAQAAFVLVKDLQTNLVKELDSLPPVAKKTRFLPISWLRAEGAFGGGTRYVATDVELFNRASVNISQVQYEKDPSKKLGSATAISAIVHPQCPFAPSLHMHVSWTEMKSGSGYWRIMADLNPSIAHEDDRLSFQSALMAASGDLFREGHEQGLLYFFIPALERHRGVAHFYLEEYSSGDLDADRQFARRFGSKVIQTYGAIVTKVLQAQKPVTDGDRRRQLDYHSLYFLQVLMLDRGTTSGLLVHDENDAGILGSLPSHVDKQLLMSWVPKHPPLQQILLMGILDLLPSGPQSLVDDTVKVRIAQAARAFYREYPQAQDFLAKGRIVPPTVANHL